MRPTWLRFVASRTSSRPPLLQRPDVRDERVLDALLDQAIGSEPHDRSAYRVAFVPPNTEGEAAGRIGAHLDHDHRVRFVKPVHPGEREVEPVAAAIELDDVTDRGRRGLDRHAVENSDTC